ncbi:MAG: gliding motility protein GldL, partial [Bacteroidales bacterium]|nr:gliding motility protein GldL [Bacteroidales bacterium]
MARKINFVVRLQHWMDSVPGQTFLNYAYSWGASIVILGTLFKLTHLPGGNFMLFVGMGTEVVVFFLAAFDRPFDKNEIGKELPHDYETDEEIAARLGLDEDEEDETEGEEETNETPAGHGIPATGNTNPAGGIATGGVVIVGGTAADMTAAMNQPTGGTTAPNTAATTTARPDAVQAAAEAIAARTPEGSEPFENEAQRLAEIIR